MMPALVILSAGLVVYGMIIGARALEALTWRRTLNAFRLYLPGNLTVDDAVRWLGSVTAITHPPRWSLFPLPPVALEVVATNTGIAHYVLTSKPFRAKLLASVQASLPGARLEAAGEHLAGRPVLQVAGEFTMTSRTRPLAFERAEAVSAAVLAPLQPLGRDERIVLQLIITSAGTPMPVPSKPSNGSSPPWWLESQAPADADAIRAERIKQRDQALRGVLRVGVTAHSRARAHELLSRTWGTMHGLNAPGVRLARRYLPSSVVAEHLRYQRYPVLWWPLLINTREAVALLAFPFRVHLPGLSLGTGATIAAIANSADTWLHRRHVELSRHG